jgi:hypothetical protein
MSTEDVLDYSRSFAINTSAQDGVERNTCRTQLLARCTLPDATGAAREFSLGKECIGEYMYQKRDIAQEPTSEVCIIFNTEDSSRLKKFANHESDVIQSGEMTVPPKGFDGSYANWTSLRLVDAWRAGRSLTSADAVIEATLAGEPMVGRTTLATKYGDAVLEYQIPYVNVHSPERRFQVDVVPVLYPDTNRDAEWMVERFRLAYVMYNQLDTDEFAIRVPTRVIADGPGRPCTTRGWSKRRHDTISSGWANDRARELPLRRLWFSHPPWCPVR